MYVNGTFSTSRAELTSRCNFHKVLGVAHKGGREGLTGSGFFCFAFSHSLAGWPDHQRPKKSQLSGQQNFMRKNFPGKVRKFFLATFAPKVRKLFLRHLPKASKLLSRLSENFPDSLESFQTFLKVSG